MFNLPEQVVKEMNDFMRVGLDKVADKGLENSKQRARVVTFRGQMERGIHKENKGDNNVLVVSSTEQGERFEEGYEGKETITPLILEWAEARNIRLSPEAKEIHVNYKDDRFRLNTHQFMLKSIPTEAEVKAVLDEFINSTMRGGTVYG